jgi:hypothetical protein
MKDDQFHGKPAFVKVKIKKISVHTSSFAKSIFIMKTGIIRYKSSLMLFSLMSEIIIALSDVLKNRTILDDRSGKTFVKCTDLELFFHATRYLFI